MESKDNSTSDKAIKKTAEIKPLTFDEVTAIIQSGDSKKLKEVIDAGGVRYVNEKNENMQTLLMIACKNHSIECARVLLDHNASINYRTDTDSVLKSACLSGNLDMLNFIIECGATINDEIIFDLFESDEILLNSEIATILVGHIQDVNGEEEGQRSFLLMACHVKNYAIAELLFERGACLRFVYPDPSEVAARGGEVETVKLVIGRHMTVENTFPIPVKEALLMVSRRGSLDDVQYIVEHAITVDVLTAALYEAIEGSHVFSITAQILLPTRLKIVLICGSRRASKGPLPWCACFSTVEPTLTLLMLMVGHL